MMIFACAKNDDTACAVIMSAVRISLFRLQQKTAPIRSGLLRYANGLFNFLCNYNACESYASYSRDGYNGSVCSARVGVAAFIRLIMILRESYGSDLEFAAFSAAAGKTDTGYGLILERTEAVVAGVCSGAFHAVLFGMPLAVSRAAHAVGFPVAAVAGADVTGRLHSENGLLQHFYKTYRKIRRTNKLQSSSRYLEK